LGIETTELFIKVDDKIARYPLSGINLLGPIQLNRKDLTLIGCGFNQGAQAVAADKPPDGAQDIAFPASPCK
jgi:hypothetical protein